ncbi:MAG: NAD(P)-dependent alcohol dehydrogenase [Clostridiales bacterium]|nr:NAD(P)-dependent alcohol dehydrogenase [Clostridiales bacterium]
MDIKAAVVYERGEPFVIRDVCLGEPKATEVLVRMVGCGICHSDLFVRDHGPTEVPAVLGHEGAGVVERVGSAVTMVAPGEHVVFCSYSCGVCEACLSGHPAWCERSDDVNFGSVHADGTKRLADKDGAELSTFFGQSSFATYVVADQRSVVSVDKSVDLAMLGPLGCGIQTGAGSIINVLAPKVGDTIAIFGCGSVGLSALMAAKLCGCSTIIGVDVTTARLDLARELGATHTINASETSDVAAEIMKITNGRGLDFTFETTAIESVLGAAVDSLRRGGACGMVGTSGERVLGLKMQTIMGQSKKLVGIVQGDSIPWLFIPKIIGLYKDGKFPFDKLITYYSFEDINKAADDSHSGVAIKPVIRF